MSGICPTCGRALAPKARFSCGATMINLDSLTGRRGLVRVEFTSTEGALLGCLLPAAPDAVPRDTLLDTAWGEAKAMRQGRSLDQNIARLRRKLRPLACGIKAAHALGYRFLWGDLV